MAALPMTPADLHLLADEAELEAARLLEASRAKARMARILRDAATAARREEMAAA